MDKETVALVLENVLDSNQAAKYMSLTKTQFNLLVENKKITSIKDHLYFKGDLDDYMKRSYSLSNKNAKEAVFYYTLQYFAHDDEKETLHLLHILENEKQFDLHGPFFYNLEIVCSYLHIAEVTFYAQYQKNEAIFMSLPINTVILSKEDALYPLALKDLKDAPYFLFVLGNLQLLETNTVGIIGSEHPREDEINKGIYLANYFMKSNTTIVSGLERGLNTYIAMELMKKQRAGIYVLSCSFTDLYPKENRQLFEYIASKGLLITQFVYHTYHNKMVGWRNPVLTALSDQCILLGGKDYHELSDFGYEAIRQNKLLLLPSSLQKSYMHFPLELVEEGAKYFSNMVELKNCMKAS